MVLLDKQESKELSEYFVHIVYVIREA